MCLESLFKTHGVVVHKSKNVMLQTQIFDYKFYFSLDRLNGLSIVKLSEYFKSWGLSYDIEAYPLGDRLEVTIWVKQVF